MKKFFKFIGIALLVMIGISLFTTIVKSITGSDSPVVVLIFALGLIPIIIMFRNYIRNPFTSPYEAITVDVSGRRNVDMADIMDEYLMADNGNSFYRHHADILNWKQNCENKIAKSVWKRHRRKQFESLIDDAHEYTFRTVRTRSKGAYNETYVDDVISVSYELISERNTFLNKIGYCMTVNEFDKELKKKEKADKKKAMLASL